MPEYLDHNDEAVAGILAAYDELVDRAERYREILEENAARDPRYVGRVDRSVEATQALLDALGGSPLDALMDVRHFANHMRIAVQGKMV